MTSRDVTGSRLGTRKRDQLAKGHGQRSRPTSNLHFAYSMKARRDCVLPTVPRLAHFLLMEANPKYLTVDYAPTELCANDGTSILACTAVTRSGEKEFHFVTSTREGAPSELLEGKFEPLQRAFNRERLELGRECSLVVLTTDDLFKNELLLNNWYEAYPWLAQYRYHSLAEPLMSVSTSLHAAKQMTVGDLLDEGSHSYVAAALQGVSAGHFDCDLHAAPFSKASTFTSKRRQS